MGRCFNPAARASCQEKAAQRRRYWHSRPQILSGQDPCGAGSLEEARKLLKEAISEVNLRCGNDQLEAAKYTQELAIIRPMQGEEKEAEALQRQAFELETMTVDGAT